jgi:hypothetical protein
MCCHFVISVYCQFYAIEQSTIVLRLIPLLLLHLGNRVKNLNSVYWPSIVTQYITRCPKMIQLLCKACMLIYFVDHKEE